ncbi:MAG TPA: hypothetical protein VGI10_08965 [Polyangiaceae bacterium]|jgi:hypothetical protein
MSDPKDPVSKRGEVSGVSRGPGRSGSAGSIGKELGGDLDFEPDALLDSLLFDEPAPASAVPTPRQPVVGTPPDLGDFGDDEEVTRVGRTEDLLARMQADDGASGLEDLASSDVDDLLSSAPPAQTLDDWDDATEQRPIDIPSEAKLPEPELPQVRTPIVPRPSSKLPELKVSAVPRPGIPRPSIETTAQPPAVNPAGPPARQPFPPAVSPALPPIVPASSAAREEDSEEHTQVFQNSLAELDVSSSAPPMLESAFADELIAPDPFAEGPISSGPRDNMPTLSAIEPPPASRMPTLHQIDEPASRLPTQPAPARVSMQAPQSLSAPTSLPAHSVHDSDLLPAFDTPDPFPAGDVLTSVAPDFESSLEADDHSPTLPPPPRSTQPEAAWPDERPAHEHLSAQAEGWIARAEWLEREAHAATDPQAKARALIVASELWALVGDLARAREVATEATALARASALSQRQLRWLAAAEGDWKATLPALEMETRSGATPEARVHAAYLSAEINRLVLDDEASAKKKIDLAVRAHQDDPRAHVAKLAELLGKANTPPRLRLPESELLLPIARAGEELAQLRGAPLAAGSTPVLPLRAAFDDARRALSNADREKAAEAIQKLQALPELADATRWLRASLLAVDAKHRPAAIALLGELVQSEGSREARRALAARALEQGDSAAVQAAISGADAEQSFGVADRLALGALTALPTAALELPLAQAASDEALRPLAAALSALATPAPLEYMAGSAAAQAELTLGRALAVQRASAVERVAELHKGTALFDESHPGSALARLLGLEFALTSQATGAVSRALADWPREQTEGPAARDQKLAAALSYELSGEHASALAEYRAALAVDPTSESAVRAIASHAPAETAERLEALADKLDGAPHTALFLLEAALRHGSDDVESYQKLLGRALELGPELSIAHRLSEAFARSRGDAEALVGALRARRDASDDPVERALDLVREALLVADSDLDLAERLLYEAIKARPNDIALRELYERVAPTESGDRAAWRERVAETSEPGLKGRLLAEAALEYARAGDQAAATRVGLAAAELGAGELTRIRAERLAEGGPGAARISEALLESARKSELADEQIELYERLSALDRSRNDLSSALLWQNAILERTPKYLPALRRLEHAYIGGDRLDELEPIAAALTRALDANEINAHARLAARLRTKRGEWPATRELADLVLAEGRDELWALRNLSAHARISDDSELGLSVDGRLFAMVERPIDKATLALRAAESAARLERAEDAKRLLRLALEQVPDHMVALTSLAEVLEATGDYTGAAEALEAVAGNSNVDAHKVNALHQAAVLWMDRVGTIDRGRLCLERAVALDVSHEDAVIRLQAAYVQAGERQKLAELLERRLEHTSDPEERIAIEVARGRALAEVGDKEAAKRALTAALDANPDHLDALEAFTELCLGEGDWVSGEQGLIRLARHLSEPARQAQIYRRLGELYDTALPNPERAELAYKEVLKRDPDDAEIVSKLVHVYGRLRDSATALKLQSDLLERASTPEQKRDRTLALAVVEEEIAGDRKSAEATLEKARKEWPHDGVVLRAVAEFQARAGDSRGMQVLLDRSAADARRALSTGRFEPGFFEVLATVAELRNETDTALLAHATLAALRGEEVPVTPAGPAAGSVDLDELLAPELVGIALRALLKKSGDVLDAAYPIDLRAMRAAPLPAGSAAFLSYVQQVAASFGIRNLDVFSSAALGQVCMPISAAPPQIVFGQALLDNSDDAVRFFLLIRALKIIQLRSAALSRTAPIDLWPVVAGYIGQFASNWQPQGVDAKKLAEARARIQSAAKAFRIDDDVPVLVLEVIGAIGNRASQLGTAIHQFGNRAALLATGSLITALKGIALAGGHTAGPPPEGPERVKWIVRNPEARDLATFGVSEQYAQARRRLGISG